MEAGKSCAHCKVFKPFSEFPIRGGKANGSLHPYCRDCCNKKAREYWARKAANPAFRTDRIVKLRVAYRHSKNRKKCLDCGDPVEDGYVYCEPDREKRRLREAERRKEKVKPRMCTQCGERASIPRGFYCGECGKLPAKRRAYMNAFYRAQNFEVIDRYGGTCACCGELNPMFLTIDHINNGGAAHRREISKTGKADGVSMYRWLRKNNYPPGFQVLCFNCNCGRARNGGNCPHQDQK